MSQSLLHNQLLVYIRNSSLPLEDQNIFFDRIISLSASAQNLVLQLFIHLPGKIDQIYEIIQKKEKFFSDGVGNINEIIEEELRLVTE